MTANRFIDKGGDPRDVRIVPFGALRDRWAVVCDGRVYFDGDIFACTQWRAKAERLAA